MDVTSILPNPKATFHTKIINNLGLVSLTQMPSNCINNACNICDIAGNTLFPFAGYVIGKHHFQDFPACLQHKYGVMIIPQGTVRYCAEVLDIV